MEIYLNENEMMNIYIYEYIKSIEIRTRREWTNQKFNLKEKRRENTKNPTIHKQLEERRKTNKEMDTLTKMTKRDEIK